jgi:hypothetical protein
MGCLMMMVQLVEWKLAEKTEVIGENLHQCHFVSNKLQMTWRGIEPGPLRLEAGDRLSYDTAGMLNIFMTLHLFRNV